MLLFEVVFWDLKLVPAIEHLHVSIQSLVSLVELPVRPHMMLEDLPQWRLDELRRKANRKERTKQRANQRMMALFRKAKAR